jgi:tetratricopeptide (TPR) repeat protein
MAKRLRAKPGRETAARRPDRQRVKRAPAAAPVIARPASPSASALPPVPQPHPEAVGLFQKGMESLQRHAYKAAADAFKALLDRFPTERVLTERTNLYLELCEREMKRRPADPRTVEERLTAATAALNSGNDDLAERLAQSVLAEDARQDLALYLMASVEARRGELEAAVSFLTRAVAISPEVRAQARYDSDFETLRHLDGYRLLIDPPSGLPAAKRARRSFR